MEVLSGVHGQSPWRESGEKPPEAEKTLQLSCTRRKSILCVTHVAPKRRDGYNACDALYGEGHC